MRKIIFVIILSFSVALFSLEFSGYGDLSVEKTLNDNSALSFSLWEFELDMNHSFKFLLEQKISMFYYI